LSGAASVGVALYPQNGATKDDLLNAADAAMYAAKHAKSPAQVNPAKDESLRKSLKSS
jgi:GGDEF domain-containing protein